MKKIILAALIVLALSHHAEAQIQGGGSCGVATTSALGCIKPDGSTVTVTPQGVLSTSAGGGNVNGPGSSTVGFAPLWSNTSGTALGVGLPVATTGNSTIVETTSGGLLATSILPLGANLTFSGTDIFNGALTFGGLTTGTQVSCLGLSSSNSVVLATGACGSGSGGVTSVTGTAGDVTVSPTTGATIVSLPATITTAKTFSNTINFTGALQVSGAAQTFPGSGLLVGTTDTQTLTNKSIAASEINSGTLAAAQMPALTGDVTSSAGSVATTLANTAVTAGSYTSTNLTVDAKGRITAASNGSGSGVSVTAGSSNIVITPTPGTGTFTVGGTTPVNAQTGTSYTMVTADGGKLVTISNASAVAVTVPQAGTTGFTTGWSPCVLNLGVGTATLTPTTSTINGAASLALTTGQFTCPVSDNTNYQAIIGLPNKLLVANGGTGATTLTAHGVILGEGTAAIAATAAGASGVPLIGQGGAADPVFGTATVAGGGTGLTSGTSGGILGFTGATTLASSAALTANGVVLGGGAGATPTSTAAFNADGQVLIGSSAGAPIPGTLTAGSNITITNAHNAITIAASAAGGGAQTVTRQLFTTGTSQTYTTPANASLLRILECAAGGGSGGLGAGAGTGGTGGTTSFNSITVIGGSGGTGTNSTTGGVGGVGGQGGTGTLGTGGFRTRGGDASDGANVVGAIAQAAGGIGGDSRLGSFQAAVASNNGAGANGDSSASALTGGSGGGGGGECADIVITTPGATFTYSVGAGGTAGAGATAGLVGNGGIIIVDEYYGTTSMVLTNHGVLLGTGSGINATAAMTSGQLLIGQGASADPLPETVSGDATITNLGAVTVSRVNGDANVAFLDINQAWTKAQAVTPFALTDAATITVDASQSNVFTVTLAGNRTLGNPTNVKAGQSITFYFTQDGTGSRTLAYASNFKFPNGTAPVLTTTAAAKDGMFCNADTTTTLNCQMALKFQ